MTLAMTLAETLANYGEYHRDPRNVLTHAVGVPMIVLAATWYLQLDTGMALLMAVLLAVFYALGVPVCWSPLSGHHYEGRRPDFLDDLRGLLHGPLFMTAEGLWAIGQANSA